MTHASIPAAETRQKLGLSDTLIRLSPGCEHRKDLVADLVEGLDAVAAARGIRSAWSPRSDYANGLRRVSMTRAFGLILVGGAV